VPPSAGDVEPARQDPGCRPRISRDGGATMAKKKAKKDGKKKNKKKK
jgi:hypothetical protein